MNILRTFILALFMGFVGPEAFVSAGIDPCTSEGYCKVGGVCQKFPVTKEKEVSLVK